MEGTGTKAVLVPIRIYRVCLMLVFRHTEQATNDLDSPISCRYWWNDLGGYERLERRCLEMFIWYENESEVAIEACVESNGRLHARQATYQLSSYQTFFT